ASQGLMTGDKPAGNLPPHSVKAGGYYVPAFVLGIPGVPLRIGADVWSAQQNGTGVSSFVRGQLEALANDSPLRGSLEIGRALTDRNPGAWDRFVQGQAQRWTPGGGLLRFAANAADPYQRQVRSVADAEQAILPGLRNALPPRLSPTGQPEANPRY